MYRHGVVGRQRPNQVLQAGGLCAKGVVSLLATSLRKGWTIACGSTRSGEWFGWTEGRALPGEGKREGRRSRGGSGAGFTGRGTAGDERD